MSGLSELLSQLYAMSFWHEKAPIWKVPSCFPPDDPNVVSNVRDGRLPDFL